MRTLKFKKIDAFASTSSSGNPAAAIYLDTLDDLSRKEMLQIAQELKGYVSEVGYVCRGTTTDYQLRYFSSEREVAFCGHATIAILNDIVASDEAMLQKKTLSIATRTDRLLVESRYEEERSVYICAPPPQLSTRIVDRADIAAALSCPRGALDELLPVQIVNGGLETLVVPMAGLGPTLAVAPDLQSLNAFCMALGVDIVILHSSEAAIRDCRYRTRVFAPTFGYLEDSATGSGNSALGYYLMNRGMWGGETICIEQNGSRDAPNFVKLFARQDDSGDSRVWFGGAAVVKIEGQYLLS